MNNVTTAFSVAAKQNPSVTLFAVKSNWCRLQTEGAHGALYVLEDHQQYQHMIGESMGQVENQDDDEITSVSMKEINGAWGSGKVFGHQLLGDLVEVQCLLDLGNGLFLMSLLTFEEGKNPDVNAYEEFVKAVAIELVK